MTRAVIMQPYYLPYRGYFSLLSSADVVVIYDDVQYRHRFWQSRNRLLIDGRWWLMTVPVFTKGRRTQQIREVETVQNGWRTSHLAQLRRLYRSAPHFGTVFPAIEEVLAREGRWLVELNVALIRVMFELGGGPLPKMVRSSELGVPNRGRTEREVDICHALGATEYISGPAARAYMKTELWLAAGLRLGWHEPDLVPYPSPSYDPYASIVDVVFWHGRKSWNYVRGRVRWEDEGQEARG